jgi:hypothetical protein
MRQISQKNRKIISSDPFYTICVRKNEGNCHGKITIDHTIIFAGRQLDKIWALLPVCEFHHAVNQHMDNGNLNREKHIQIALNRASEEELKEISKATDYIRLRSYLNQKYGVCRVPVIAMAGSLINY